MDDPLIWVRAFHFASTLLATGAVFFLVFIAEPAFRKANGNEGLPAVVYSRLGLLLWPSLIVVVISGVAWLFLLTTRMVDQPLRQIFSDTAVWTVITQTDFGHVWIVRLVLLGLLVVALFPMRATLFIESLWPKFFAVFLTAGLVGTLAWAGHAAVGSGSEGAIHLTADILHLLAAAAWVGALVPLALLLEAVVRNSDQPSLAIASEVVLRFSMLGIASVTVLLATGVYNSWMLVGSVIGLVTTDYGRLLSAKIALFLVMLAIAGVNRFVLTPRIIRARGSVARQPLRQLRNNSLIEATIGALILIIVGVLGTLPPGIQEQTVPERLSALSSPSNPRSIPSLGRRFDSD